MHFLIRHIVYWNCWMQMNKQCVTNFLSAQSLSCLCIQLLVETLALTHDDLASIFHLNTWCYFKLFTRLEVFSRDLLAMRDHFPFYPHLCFIARHNCGSGVLYGGKVLCFFSVVVVVVFYKCPSYRAGKSHPSIKLQVDL